MVKTRILAGVGKNQMVRLSFTALATKTQLRWEHSKEFEYKGEMYDIQQPPGIPSVADELFLQV